jgi:hypothetical protein
MNRTKLLQYCEANKIAVPKDATVEQLNAAIVRAAFHKTEVKQDKTKSCFGFWENEDSNCGTCDFEGKCFKASFGVDKQTYFKKMEAIENPRIRFYAKPLAKFKKAKL